MKGLYEQTILPTPFRVLGRSLRPFSFGHFIILRANDVGFVSDKIEKLTVEDLIFSVFVCSHTFAECKELIYSGKWEEEASVWGKALAEYDIDMSEKAILFNQYLAHHTVRPKIKPAPGAGTGPAREANAEWYEGIIRTLRKCGYTNDQVMDMCYSQALYEYTSYLESEGRVTILSDKNEKGLQYIKELKRQKEQDARPS